MLEEEDRNAVAERVGRNDALFRDANEQIKNVAASMDLDETGLIPFICECADIDCRVLLQLTGLEYEAIRQAPVRFLNAPGHVRNALGWARVVGEFDRYVVVETIGDAAEVAIELDPRAEGAR